MRTTAVIDSEDDFFLLSNLAPSAPQKRPVAALLATLVIAAGLPANLRPPAGIALPACATVLFLTETITAVL